jgi:hypothetical protein
MEDGGQHACTGACVPCGLRLQTVRRQDFRPLLGSHLAKPWFLHQMVGLKRRGALFNRAVAPLLSFRCPRWIYSQASAKMLISQQVKMASTMVRFRVDRQLSWRQNWQKRMGLLEDAKVLGWDKMWKACSVRWHQRLDRHPALLPVRMRRLLVAQGRINDLRRARMALRGMGRSLGYRRAMGQPRRLLHGILNFLQEP